MLSSTNPPDEEKAEKEYLHTKFVCILLLDSFKDCENIVLSPVTGNSFSLAGITQSLSYSARDPFSPAGAKLYSADLISNHSAKNAIIELQSLEDNQTAIDDLIIKYQHLAQQEIQKLTQKLQILRETKFEIKDLHAIQKLLKENSERYEWGIVCPLSLQIINKSYISKNGTSYDGATLLTLLDKDENSTNTLGSTTLKFDTNHNNIGNIFSKNILLIDLIQTYQTAYPEAFNRLNQALKNYGKKSQQLTEKLKLWESAFQQKIASYQMIKKRQNIALASAWAFASSMCIDYLLTSCQNDSAALTAELPLSATFLCTVINAGFSYLSFDTQFFFLNRSAKKYLNNLAIEHTTAESSMLINLFKYNPTLLKKILLADSRYIARNEAYEILLKSSILEDNDYDTIFKLSIEQSKHEIMRLLAKKSAGTHNLFNKRYIKTALQFNNLAALKLLLNTGHGQLLSSDDILECMNLSNEKTLVTLLSFNHGQYALSFFQHLIISLKRDIHRSHYRKSLELFFNIVFKNIKILNTILIPYPLNPSPYSGDNTDQRLWGASIQTLMEYSPYYFQQDIKSLAIKAEYEAALVKAISSIPSFIDGHNYHHYTRYNVNFKNFLFMQLLDSSDPDAPSIYEDESQVIPKLDSIHVKKFIIYAINQNMLTVAESLMDIPLSKNDLTEIIHLAEEKEFTKILELQRPLELAFDQSLQKLRKEKDNSYTPYCLAFSSHTNSFIARHDPISLAPSMANIYPFCNKNFKPFIDELTINCSFLQITPAT